VKEYQAVRENIITMLEDLSKNLEDVLKEEQLFENRVNKERLEIEKTLLSDKRFMIKIKK
jgi:hypothetical protein